MTAGGAASGAGLVELVRRPAAGSEYVFAYVPLSDEEDLRTRIAIEEVYVHGCFRVCSHGISTKEREFLNRPEHGGEKAHVYGDTSVDLVLPLFLLLRKGRAIGPEDSFVDLGSGDGKLTLLMRLLTPASAVGVELSPTRHAEAAAAVLQVRQALAQERQSGLVDCSGATADVRLLCGSMLQYAGLADTTLVFVYNLCLDVPFLQKLRTRLLSQLPTGASVLVRGKALPDDDGSMAMGGDREGRRKRLALRLRLTMFYGYQVVEEANDGSKPAAAAGAAAIMRPKLKQEVGTLGSTKFERIFFAEAPPDHVVTAAEIASW